MTVVAEKKIIQAAEYNEVVDAAHLLDVKMIESEFNIRAAYFAEEKENIRFVYGCDAGPQHYSMENGRLIGTFHLEAGAKHSRKFLLRAKATYVIAFAVEGKPSMEGALAYLARVGSFGCWPYFRSHFATLCGAAGADAPPLPIMTGNLPTKIT